MTTWTIESIGEALLTGTLRVADFDFQADQVTCLSVAVVPTASADPTCVIYRDGRRQGHEGFPVGSDVDLKPLFATAAAEPFTCNSIEDMAGLVDRLMLRLDERVAERLMAKPESGHYHVHEHWMGSHAGLEPVTHVDLNAARADASGRAEWYRTRRYQVEGSPLVGYLISESINTCLIQVVPCHGATCLSAPSKPAPSRPIGRW